MVEYASNYTEVASDLDRRLNELGWGPEPFDVLYFSRVHESRDARLEVELQPNLTLLFCYESDEHEANLLLEAQSLDPVVEVISRHKDNLSADTWQSFYVSSCPPSGA